VPSFFNRKSPTALAGVAGSIRHLTFAIRIVALVRLIDEARNRVCVRGARNFRNRCHKMTQNDMVDTVFQTEERSCAPWLVSLPVEQKANRSAIWRNENSRSQSSQWNVDDVFRCYANSVHSALHRLLCAHLLGSCDIRLNGNKHASRRGRREPLRTLRLCARCESL
jgi:hypothetical protein